MAEVRLRKTILIALVALIVATFPANGQTQKHWRDRTEYELFARAKGDATPGARLQVLDKWKGSYPQSDFADERLQIYLRTYQGMNNHRQAFDTAWEILKSQPNDLSSLLEIVEYGLQLLPKQPNATLSEENKSDLATIQKTSRYILENLDMIFGASKRPQPASDEEWRSARIKMQDTAQSAMNRVAALATQN